MTHNNESSLFYVYALFFGLANPSFIGKLNYTVRYLFYSKEGIIYNNYLFSNPSGSKGRVSLHFFEMFHSNFKVYVFSLINFKIKLQLFQLFLF